LACLKELLVEIPSLCVSMSFGEGDSEAEVDVLQLDEALEEAEHCSPVDPSTN
jgi:hypothetical protein